MTLVGKFKEELSQAKFQVLISASHAFSCTTMITMNSVLMIREGHV